MLNNTKIKFLIGHQQQKAARDIFDKTWAMELGTEITPNLLQAMVHSGSYLTGAFIGEKCVGAAFAFPATNGGLHLHSHMTAVLDDYRDQGIGYALKIDQWQWAKKNNYKQITWTFDPLVARNARLNLIKLGVDISAYYPNFYGDMPDVLNAGDESDRVMASWKVYGEQPLEKSIIINPNSSDILIKIPDDIIDIRKRNFAESLKWRLRVREQFIEVLAKGGRVIGLTAEREYVLQL